MHSYYHQPPPNTERNEAKLFVVDTWQGESEFILTFKSMLSPSDIQ